MRASAADAASGADASGHPSARSRVAIRASQSSKHRAATVRRRGLMMGDSSAVGAIGQPAHFSLVHGDPLSDPAALWRIWLTR